MKYLRSCTFVVAVVLVGAAAVARQDAVGSVRDKTPLQQESGQGVRLHAGDNLRIIFVDIEGPNTETVREVRVDAGGYVQLPPDGMPVRAAGRTVRELAVAIQQAYRDANLMQNLEVRVEIVRPETTTRPAS